MPHTFPPGLDPTIYYTCLGCPPSPGPPPGPGVPLAAISTSKQGFGLRILIDFDFGASGTLSVSQSTVTPPGGAKYYASVRTVSDLSSVADWAQIPDVDIVLDNKNVLFNGTLQEITRIQRDFGFENRTVTVRFWIEGTTFSSALTVAKLITRAPVEYTEKGVSIRALGIQRAIPDRIGDVVTIADLANADPREYGKIFPLAFGQAKRVRGIRAKVGRTAILEGFIDDNDTTITANDLTDWPATGSFKVGDEIMTYTGISGADFTGVSRGTSSTAAAFHATGDQIIEQTSEIWVFNGMRSQSIGTIRAETGLEILGGTKNAADAALIAGKTLATVTYTTPPEIDEIEGGTSILDIGLDLRAGDTSGPITFPQNAFRNEPDFTPDNFAVLSPDPTTICTLVGEVPSDPIEDLGEIVKVAVGVRHFGFGDDTNVPFVAVVGEANLGSLAKGQILDSAALDFQGNSAFGGNATPTTDITHGHTQQIQAFSTSTTPDDSVDDATGWVTAVGATAICGGNQVLPPTLKRSALMDDNTVAIYMRQSGDDTLQLKYDRPGSVGDFGMKILRATLIIIHGISVEVADIRVRWFVNGNQILQLNVNPATTRTLATLGPIDVSARNLTIGDLHNGNSRIDLIGRGTVDCTRAACHVTYVLLECVQGLSGSDTGARIGSGPIAGQTNIDASQLNPRKTWEEVEEFFEIPPAQIGTGANLFSDIPALQLQITSAPTFGARRFIREVFLRVEYRKRRRRKVETLFADVNGPEDQGHSQANGFYTGGAAGTLIERPVDVLGFLLVEVLGQAAGNIDFTFNATQRALYDTDGHVFAGALVEETDSIRLIQRMLLEGRMRFFLELDKLRIKYIPLIESSSTFDFDSSNIVVNQSVGTPIRAMTLRPDTIINRIDLFYGRRTRTGDERVRRHNPTAPGADDSLPRIDEFRKVATKQDSTSIASHEQKRRPYYADFLGESATTVVDGLAQLFIDKYKDTRTKFTFEASFESLAVAVDDVVTVTWPTLSLNAVKCRVTKETFLVGEVVTGQAPRKRYEVIELFASEQS